MSYGTPKRDGSGNGNRLNYGRGGCIPGINGKDELFGLAQAEPVTEPVVQKAGWGGWVLFAMVLGGAGYILGQAFESAKWKKYRKGPDGAPRAY